MPRSSEAWVTSMQERQVAACEKLMGSDAPTRLKVFESEERLEKTRLYGPFDVETVAWVAKMIAQCPRFVKFGQDEVGEYVQY